MEIPKPVVKQIKIAREALFADPEAALRPFQRKQLLQTILKSPDGDFVRKKLALITSQSVLPIWQAKFSEPTFVEQSLKCCESFLYHSREKDRLSIFSDQLYRFLEDVYGDYYSSGYEYTRALFAAEAILYTTALLTGYDSWFNPHPNTSANFGETLTDESLEDYQSDVAKWASFAWAGQAHDSDFDREKRLEFWLWWLDSAIPKSWS